jgi:Restriction endonuclease
LDRPSKNLQPRVQRRPLCAKVPHHRGNTETAAVAYHDRLQSGSPSDRIPRLDCRPKVGLFPAAGPKHADYLLRRIRDERDPLHAKATALGVEMREIGLRMIRQLDSRDFETLVDSIFARGGWQRSSVLGKNQADVDLILTQPTIGETAWVQIKSGTSQVELDVGRFRRDGSCDRFLLRLPQPGRRAQPACLQLQPFFRH